MKTGSNLLSITNNVFKVSCLCVYCNYYYYNGKNTPKTGALFAKVFVLNVH